MIQDIDRWIATTRAVRNSLETYGVGPSKIVDIPNGVALPEIHPAEENYRKIASFLYLGRLSTNSARDIPTLIRAFDRLANQSSDVQLALVGDGDLYQETKSLVDQTRHHTRILMPGLQQPEEWLNWAHCMVLPSLFEGLSNSLLEAMSYGLPIIANDIPPNREVLDDGKAGILVPVGNEQRLYDEMLRLTNNPHFAFRMGANALKRVKERYAIEKVAEQYISLYRQLIWKAKKIQ